MERRALILITADPSQSRRVAEAVRVAAGLAGWDRSELVVVFWGPAAQVFPEPDLLWPEAEELRRYLADLCTSRAALFVGSAAQGSAAAPGAGVQTSSSVFTRTPEPIALAQLARLVAEQDMVLRF